MLRLFELSKFSENQLEFMRSMSLMGDIRISRTMFLEWCTIEEKETVLQYLIRRGWVQSDEKTEKIALHQIILDMVYNYLQPTSENCSHIVNSMIAYAEEKLETYEQQWNRLMVLDSVLDRIQGLDDSYFKLMTVGGWLLFGWNLKSNRSEEVLDAAFSCLDKLMDDFECVDIQQKYAETGMQRKVFHLHAIMEDAREWDFEEIEEEVILERLQCVESVGKWVLVDEKKLQISSGCKVRCLWHTAAAIRTILSELDEDFVRENSNMANSLLSVAKKSLDKIEKYIEGKEFEQWKEAYYEAMENFYFGREFTYALEKGVIAKTYMQSCRNAGKVIYYQLKQEKGYVSTMTEVFGKFALHSKIAENYYCALRFYLKAYNRIRWKFWNSDYRLNMWEYDIAECYNMLGETKKAIRILLRADKRNGLDKEQCSLLINLLKKEGREREAKRYTELNITSIAGQLEDEMQQKELEAEEGEHDKRIKDIQEWQLISLTQKYNQTVTEGEKEKIWKECLSVYKELVSGDGLLEDSFLYGEKESGILNFYCLYLRQLLEEEFTSRESIKLQMDIFLFMFTRCYYNEEWNEHWNNLRILYESLISKYRRQVKEDEFLRNYLLYIEIGWLKRLEEKDGGLQDVTLEEQFLSAGTKCDFCLVAEQRSLRKNNEKKYELWEDAELLTDRFKRYEDREACFEKQFALLEPVFGLLDMEKSAEYWRTFKGEEVNEEDVRKSSIFYFWGKVQNRLDNIIRLENHDKMNKLVLDLYEKLIRYYGYELFTKDDVEAWQEMFSKWKRWDKGRNNENFFYETNNQEYARRVADLSNYLHQLAIDRPASILGMLSIYIGLIEEPDREFLRAVYPEREDSVELLISKLEKRLKQSVDAKFSSVVCERILDMLEWFPEDADLQLLKQGMEGFLARYQELEFK